MFQPLSDFIQIEPITKEKKHGILLCQDDTPKSYKVIAIGDKVSKVSPNDEIIIEYPRQITYDDKPVLFVKEEQIISKVVL
jgi:hypothetical protein